MNSISALSVREAAPRAIPSAAACTTRPGVYIFHNGVGIQFLITCITFKIVQLKSLYGEIIGT